MAVTAKRIARAKKIALAEMEPQWQSFIARLVGMKAEADRLGLHATARAMDTVTQKVGWEVANLIMGLRPLRTRSEGR